MVMSFRYKAYTVAGTHMEGVVDALDKDDAAKQISTKGLKPYFIETDGGKKSLGLLFTRDKNAPIRLKHGECSKFFNGISVLLNSGFELDEALTTSLKIETGTKLKKCYLAVREETQRGEPFAVALENNLQLPGFATAIVRSGEQTGDLKSATERLSHIFQEREKVRSEVLSAVTYPIFLMCLLLIIVVLLALKLVPALAPLFSDGDTALPPLLGFLLALGNVISQYGLLITAFLLALLLGLLHPGAREKLRAVTASVVRKLPWVGDFFRRAMTGLYLRTLATLIMSKIPLPEALALSAASLILPEDKKRFSAAYRQVVEGKQLSLALRDTQLLDDYVISLLAIGERSNALGKMVERSADIVEAKVKTTLDNFLGALSPSLTILIGLIVGSLVVSVMTALLSLNEAVLQ